MHFLLKLDVFRFFAFGQVFIVYNQLLCGGGAWPPATENFFGASIQEDDLGDGAGTVGQELVHQGGVVVAEEAAEVEFGRSLRHPVKDG